MTQLKCPSRVRRKQVLPDSVKPAAVAAMTSEKKVFRADEVKQHTRAQSAWFIIDNRVYDVTKLVRVHPGGDQILLENAGTDVTEKFDNVGHSIDARDLKETFYIGDLHPDDQCTHTDKPTTEEKARELSVSPRPGGWWTVVPVVLLLALAYNYLFS